MQTLRKKHRHKKQTKQFHWFINKNGSVNEARKQERKGRHELLVC